MHNDNFSKPDTMFSGTLNEESLRIKIIGVGGAGNNAVDRLKMNDLTQVHLAAVNTDLQTLSNSLISEKVMIGRGVTRGMSTGGEVALGRKAAEADRGSLEKLVNGCDLIFILAGLGGGTGSGAAPLLAELASAEGALVIAFVMLPFTFEGGRRKKAADESLAELRKTCDAVIPLPNDILLQNESGGDESSVLDAFGQADEWIRRGVQSICSLLLRTGLINQDFSTLKQVFVERGGKTVFGLGYAEGPDAVKNALNDLLLCPLMHTPDFSRKADNLLVQITGGPDLSIGKVNEIMATVSEKLGCRENTVLGATIDEGRQNSVEICAIGTTNISTKGYKKPPAAAVSHNAGASRKGKTAPPLNPATQQVDEMKPVEAPETLISPDSMESHAPAREPLKVHESKLGPKSKQANFWDQEEFELFAQEEQRGYFDNTERNIYDGVDLDVPTYMREGIRINLKE